MEIFGRLAADPQAWARRGLSPRALAKLQRLDVVRQERPAVRELHAERRLELRRAPLDAAARRVLDLQLAERRQAARQPKA